MWFWYLTLHPFGPTVPLTFPDHSFLTGPYLTEAPVFIDKPDIVYMVENQPVNMTVTLNHVQATVIWKRQVV